MTAATTIPARSDHRSTFVTVVAWVFLAFGALAVLGSLLSVVILAVTPAATVDAVVNRVAQDTTATNLLPAPYRFMVQHVYLVAFIRLAWWVAVVLASIGILRRKEWGRRAFVAVLGIQIVLVVIGLIVGQSIGMSLATRVASQSPSGQVPPGMGSGLALAGLLTVAVAAVLMWLLVAFRSARVRAEFGSTARAA